MAKGLPYNHVLLSNPTSSLKLLIYTFQRSASRWFGNARIGYSMYRLMSPSHVINGWEL